MMEGMNQAVQEEYIWAMRTSAYHESDSELWKSRRYTQRSNLSSLHLKKSKSVSEPNMDQTKVMASMVPDEVINNVNDYSHRQYDACFLFGDVSGFTELCEKYTKTGVSGPSRMTQVLNKYLGSMVQEVLSHNGDVLKFSGDAFLAMYKTTEAETMCDAVHEALDSALVIQKNYGSYLTDVGVVIRVKLAISAGLVTFALIGNQTTSHYVVVGKPIWDVKAAESISSAGDIVIAPAARHYVSTNEYVFKEMPDNTHIKLVGVGPNWRSVQKNVRQQKQDEDVISVKSDESDDSELGQIEDTVPMDEFSLRPAVNKAVRLRIIEPLRKFIIAPVMKSIDKGEPFVYLSEMRQAVVVFINVVSKKLENGEIVRLSDQTYKIVCRVVDKMQGCVNKVSLFDKDLMFLVIFGLRGLKHELECQVALRCARECHEAINALPGVLSISIGVTTGKTYCGVFGHALRREYTVISLIVNKAARLMVAYKNKVTCDRDTFLHSKLEARHFVLQEYKPLKGISHPGPVYEFKETEIDYSEIQRMNARPFLGRNEYLKIYLHLLAQCKTSSKKREQHYKMVVIKGVARQGKTRLLDELVYITSDDTHVNRFTLTRKHRRIPYQALRLIFYSPLKLTTHSSIKQKEEAILKKLRKIQVPDLLCVLNNVLGVNFKNSKLYLSLDDKGRLDALRKMLKQLCYVCFPTFWVHAIDDWENMDEKSSSIFDVLFEIKTVFLVVTMSRDKLDGTNIPEKLLRDSRVKELILKPIEKMYLGALACQILDVYAISPELENAVQTRSNGNPGWVESFLISLYQDSAIVILKASLQEINDLGLVVPPLYMMARLNRQQTLKWKHLMEEKSKSQDSLEDEDKWSAYIDCCRDSYLNITIREQLEVGTKGIKVPICVISENFHLGEGQAELSMDSMILRTFDSLSFFEQLLVKCSAILGHQFSRDMMLYVMSADDKRKAALAVQKLFEIKVLCCAKGDFVEGGALVFKERLLNPVNEQGFLCQCKGLKVHEQCMDLPRYANCGYLQFRSSLFREITYNLLTDNQKKEFHLRAIRYLEKETRKCKACGNGFFHRIVGTKHDKEFLIARDQQTKKKLSTSSWESASSRKTSAHSVATTTSQGSASKKTTGSRTEEEKKSFLSHQASLSTRSQIYSETKGDNVFQNMFGFSIIKKLKQSFSLTRAFSSDDFTDCQCLQILSTTYAQLIEHCTGASELNKVVEAMLEYADISIILCNVPLALRILEECLTVLQEMADKKCDHLWKLSLIRGKVYTLMGFSKMELGLYNAAYKILHKGLQEYGITFPTGRMKKLKKCQLLFKQFLGFYLFPRILMKHFDHWETVYANNLSRCLSHLCVLYMRREDWSNAELAACWSLSKALQSFSDFQVICIACANMIIIAQHFKRWNLCMALEIHSLRLCHLKKTAAEASDLKCVAKMYAVIFTSRVRRLSMDKAIHIGYIVLRMCSSIRATKIILPLLPLLIHCLLIGNHFNNAYSILQELDFFSNLDADNSGKIWYYALCITLQIETGYSIVPYHVSEQIFQIEGENWVTVRDPDARKRFFTIMWLWCVRNEKWEEASIWCLKTPDFMILSPNDSLANKVTALYLLEGLIIYLVSKLDKRNIEAVIRAENEISSLIRLLDEAATTTAIIQPRLEHLKAYFKYVKNCESKIMDTMSKAKKLAEKSGNILEAAWIEHNLKAWSRSLPAILVDFWKDHVDPESLLDFQDLEVSEGKVGYYTLPIPIYI